MWTPFWQLSDRLLISVPLFRRPVLRRRLPSPDLDHSLGQRWQSILPGNKCTLPGYAAVVSRSCASTVLTSICWVCWANAAVANTTANTIRDTPNNLRGDLVEPRRDLASLLSLGSKLVLSFQTFFNQLLTLKIQIVDQGSDRRFSKQLAGSCRRVPPRHRSLHSDGSCYKMFTRSR